jgi:hypothetical protein
MHSQARANAITQHLSHLNAYIPLAFSVIHPTTGKAMEYQELITNPESRDIWLTSSANELG